MHTYHRATRHHIDIRGGHLYAHIPSCYTPPGSITLLLHTRVLEGVRSCVDVRVQALGRWSLLAGGVPCCVAYITCTGQTCA